MGDSGAPNDENGSNGKPHKKSGAGATASSIGRMVAYSHIAYMFIGAFGLPTALGIWIDSGSSETSPWGTILGVTLGLILSTIVAYREVRTTGTRLSKPKKKQPEPAGDEDNDENETTQDES